MTSAVQGGVPLTLTINLIDTSAACTPQAGMYVDIWHANAQGAYSDVSGSGNPNNVGVDWLRGYQVSDENGSVTFRTIYPGWYVGRTIHVHVRIRSSLGSSASTNFTTQLFFDEAVTSTVVATSAYAKSGSRTTNSTDSLYEAATVMPVSGSTSAGYTGAITLALAYGDGAPSTEGGTVTGGGTSVVTADNVVDGSVLGAHARRRGGRRQVVVRLRGGESLATKVRLVRHDNVLVHRSWGWLPAGSRQLRLTVPRSVPAGHATVSVILVDRAGNAKTSRVPVRIPAR